jgi:AraC family transcriptional regulator, transcriptional activator of the genes for pyochelin and ferripyochelin receptors
MDVTDYRTLVDPSKTYAGLRSQAGIYADGDGVQFRSIREDGGEVPKFFHEAVRISDNAYLLLTESAPTENRVEAQLVEGDDWLHVQFRFNGAGHEQVGEEEIVETPERSCIVSRYPNGSVVNREIRQAETWKYACLYLRPMAFTSLLDISETALPETSSWMAKRQYTDFRCDTLPISPVMMAPLRDIFTCDFRGLARRGFMRAKSLEILSILVHALDHSTAGSDERSIKLSASDLAKLAAARALMTDDLENSLSLASLARCVGLNRTKLAEGFKATYGYSVHAYWRDIRLTHAREMLKSGDTSVTEAAFSVGYSDISAFTRAFNNKFGVRPKAFKPSH